MPKLISTAGVTVLDKNNIVMSAVGWAYALLVYSIGRMGWGQPTMRCAYVCHLLWFGANWMNHIGGWKCRRERTAVICRALLRCPVQFTALCCLVPVSVSTKERGSSLFLPEILKPEEKSAEERKEERFWMAKARGGKLKAIGLMWIQRNRVRSSGARSKRKLATQLLLKWGEGSPAALAALVKCQRGNFHQKNASWGGRKQAACQDQLAAWEKQPYN